MKNLKEPEGLALLKKASVRMGLEPSLIQASGGNTSLKEDGILWVKASGKTLGSAMTEAIFLPLDLAQILAENKNGSAIQATSLTLSGESLRPSIETSLHALMPYRVVLHSHSIEVIAHTLLKHAREHIGFYLEGLSWQWIPYHRPGKPLARAVSSALNSKRSNVLILENHGLVVGGDTIELAECLQAEVVTRLRAVVRTYEQPHLPTLHSLVNRLSDARLPNKSVVHSLATDTWSLSLARQNPPYPDHVVFCGVRPLVFNATEHSREQLIELIQKREPNVSYVLLAGIGVILLSNATAATEAMLQAQAEVFLRIPEDSNVHLLSDAQCAELMNWDAEKYRKAMETVV